MKLVLFLLILVFTQTIVLSQTLPEWFRVHTFDDKSIVELNTNYVMFSSTKTERVRFRWTYTEPQSLSKDSQTKYQSILQEVAFDCRNERYAVYETKWFDADGKLIQINSAKKELKWQEVIFSSIINKLYPQACKLIELRRREPALEQ